MSECTWSGVPAPPPLEEGSVYYTCVCVCVWGGGGGGGGGGGWVWVAGWLGGCGLAYIPAFHPWKKVLSTWTNHIAECM